MAAFAKGQGIPRLQELRYLLVAAVEVGRGATYDQVRLALVRAMAERSKETIPSGNSAARRSGGDSPGHFVDNATAALGELMRIGLVERSPLPSSAKAARSYVNARFLLTDAGVDWIELLEVKGDAAALDALLKRLWTVHPQLADYLRLLSTTDVFLVPMLTWTAVHPNGSGPDGRQAYIDALVERATEAAESGPQDRAAASDEIRRAIKAYIGRREAFAAKRGRPAYARSRDFVRDCDEAVTVLALRNAGVTVDYTSFEIIRRWTQDLLVANFSYRVPEAPRGLRLWETALLREADGIPDFDRRPPTDAWIKSVEQCLPEAFARAMRDESGSSFVPIWKVRASVCLDLHVNDVVFDDALRSFQTRARKGELPFDLALEVSTGGTIPPTERPFRGVPDRYGSEPLYTLINVNVRRERTRS